MAKFPPRGYKQKEFPLPHDIDSFFTLNVGVSTKAATIIPLLETSEQVISAESIEVHPYNLSFSEENSHMIHFESVVDRMMLKFTISLTKASIETDGVRSLLVKYMPIYMAFVDDYDAMDDKTDTDIEALIEMQHAENKKDGYPLYNGTDISTGGIPMSNVNFPTQGFADMGLTTDTKIEAVGFNEQEFFDAMSYYSNKGKLKKVVGQLKSVIVTRDRPFRYYSNNYTNGTVKRGNPYTFCGMLFYVPQAGTIGQHLQAADVTTSTGVYVEYQTRYDEWNSEFYQGRI